MAEKKGIIETHNPYKKGGPFPNGPEKCDGEKNNVDPAFSLLQNAKDKKTKKPLLTKSQKDFAKKLGKALSKKDPPDPIGLE